MVAQPRSPPKCENKNELGLKGKQKGQGAETQKDGNPSASSWKTLVRSIWDWVGLGWHLLVVCLFVCFNPKF